MKIEKQWLILGLFAQGRYSVDLTTGNVISHIQSSPRVVKPILLPNGYHQYRLDIGYNMYITAYGQGIVYLARFRQPYNPKFVIDHKDRNRSNNHPDNLRCITQAENLQGDWRSRKRAYKPRIRLPIDIRQEIRGRAKVESQVKLASEFGVSRQTIARIVGEDQ